MKSLSKKLVAIFLGAVVTSGAFAASGASYTAPSSGLKATPNDSWVVLMNNTNDTYMSYATFYNSGKSVNVPLERRGDSQGHDKIYYHIDTNYDYKVCLRVVRNFDQATVIDDCFSAANISIDPALGDAKDKTAKPVIHVVKQ